MIDLFDGKYHFLSNFFYPTPVVFQGEIYISVEHAYQAAKFLDPDLRKQIQGTPTPAESKKLAKKFQKDGHRRSNWDDIKLAVMEDLLVQKFSDIQLRRKLVATGNNELVEENWWHDVWWGKCGGVGENNLGKLLMKIRVQIGKDKSLIPKGIYCYDNLGLCPYWDKSDEHPHQENGYCAFLGRGDWEAEIPADFPGHFPVSCVSLLWDQVKECHENMDEPEDDG
jgi:N-glycosidase YbiA